MTATLQVNPSITAEQLHIFYRDNGICEAELDPKVAARVLEHSSLIVAAFEGETLVALTRACFDGVAACVMELSVALRHQGEDTRYQNGSLVEADQTGLGQRVGQRLVEELRSMGAVFIEASIAQGCEEPFYEQLGFVPNESQRAYYIDERPYAGS